MPTIPQIRRRKSYKRFAAFYEYLKGGNNTNDILYRIHGRIECFGGFGSRTASVRALESVRTVIDDHTTKNVCPRNA